VAEMESPNIIMTNIDHIKISRRENALFEATIYARGKKNIALV
jgi:hypothetical protein